MPESPERQRHLLHVHQLAPEIGVRRQIAVGRVEVPLRIEKGEVHTTEVYEPPGWRSSVRVGIVARYPLPVTHEEDG